MAYAGTATVTALHAVGGNIQDRQAAGNSADYRLVIVETGATTTDELEIVLATAGLPVKGRVHAQYAILSAGTGTTIDPVLGLATNPAATAWRIENGTPAAAVHNQPSSPVKYTGASFFHRARPDAAADNSITTTYLISAGW